MKLPGSFTTVYKNTAVIFLNILVAGGIFILCGFLFFRPQTDTDGGWFTPGESHALLKRIYPDATDAEINRRVAATYPYMALSDAKQLLAETWSRPLVYDAFVQFREAPFEGRFVNVDEKGFRRTKDQGPWPPKKEHFSVFLFGGSTAFGYGVPDDESLASHLQEVLNKTASGKRVYVYNFGQGFYYSSQERILFERFISRGEVPDAVIFLDGLNEFANLIDEPEFSTQIGVLFDSYQRLHQKAFRSQGLERIGRLWAVLRSLWVPVASKNSEAIPHKKLAPAMIYRYLQNRIMIEGVCRQKGILPVFVWQPTASFNYKYNPSGKAFTFRRYDFVAYAYRYFAEQLKKKSLGQNFIWLADIQKNIDKRLYVDNSHYSSEMLRFMAEALTKEMVARGLWRDEKGYFADPGRLSPLWRA